MSRGGTGVYDSDAAMDYFASITDMLDREINYWCVPEKVFDKAWWLENVLAPVEVLLLFDTYIGGITVFLSEPEIVIRWRETFLRVWDGDWREDNHYKQVSCNEPDYRKLHRPGVVVMFDRLESVAHHWKIVGTGVEPPEITPLHPDYPLPFFSATRRVKPNKTVIPLLNQFIQKLIQERIQEILYWLTCKRWMYVANDQVIASVDVLGFLCEVYDWPPDISEELIHTWRTSVLQMVKDSPDEGWGETVEFYQEVEASFDRLEAVARKYPPIEW